MSALQDEFIILHRIKLPMATFTGTKPQEIDLHYLFVFYLQEYCVGYAVDEPIIVLECAKCKEFFCSNRILKNFKAFKQLLTQNPI